MGWGLLKFLWLLLNRIWIYGGGRDRKREQRGVLFPWALIQNAWISVGNKQKKKNVQCLYKGWIVERIFFSTLITWIIERHFEDPCLLWDGVSQVFSSTQQSLLSDEWKNINKWGFIAGLKKFFIKKKTRVFGVSFCSESEGVGLQRVLKGMKSRERKRER